MENKFKTISKKFDKLSSEKLTNILQSDIRTQNIKKNGWYIYVVIAIINGLTTGFLGFPDIGDIASVDNITNMTSGFSIYDKVFMMFATGLMMWPFFQQIFSSKVHDKINEETHNKREGIINAPANKLRNDIKKSNAIFVYDIIGVIIVSTLIGFAFSITLQYGVTLISFFIITTIASLSLLKMGRNLLFSLVKNNIAKDIYGDNSSKIYNLEKRGDAIFVKNGAISRFKSNTKTKNIIREAIKELKLIQHSHPNKNEITSALLHSIYQKQLMRIRLAIFNGNYRDIKKHISFSDMAMRNTKSIMSPLYQQLKDLDVILEESPLIKLQEDLKKENISYEKYESLLKVVSEFRAKLIDDKLVIMSKCNSKEIIENFLKNKNINNDIDIKKALIAEIKEEMSLYIEGTSKENALRIMQKRFEERNNLELDLLLSLEKNNSWDIYFWIGNIVGTVNALVNGVITAAVIGKLLMVMIPILFGASISSPIALAAIFGVTAIVGFYSSFTITRKSMIRVFKKIGKDMKKDGIVTEPTNKKGNLYLKLAIILASLGLGLLAGLQVYSILSLYLASGSIYAAAIVGITTVFAVYSLFTDYAAATIAKQEEKNNLIDNFFTDESEKNKILDKIYLWNLVLSLVIGIAVAVLVESIYPHIVISCTLGIFATFISSLVISIVSNDQYKKPGINMLNVYSKAGMCITLLYTGCLLVSVSTGIFKLGLISFMPANLIVAIAIGLIVSAFYFPYVWNTATSPEINFEDTIIEIKDNKSNDSNKNTLSSNIVLISYVFSIVMFLSIFFTITTLMPNIIGFGVASLLASFVTIMFCKDYIYSGVKSGREFNQGEKISLDIGNISKEVKKDEFGRHSPSGVANIVIDEMISSDQSPLVGAQRHPSKN